MGWRKSTKPGNIAVFGHEKSFWILEISRFAVFLKGLAQCSLTSVSYITADSFLVEELWDLCLNNLVKQSKCGLHRARQQKSDVTAGKQLFSLEQTHLCMAILPHLNH